MPDLTETALRDMLADLLDLKDEITLKLAGKQSLSSADIQRIRKSLDPMRGKEIADQMSAVLGRYSAWSAERGVEMIDAALGGETIDKVLRVPETTADVTSTYDNSRIVTIAPDLLDEVRKLTTLSFLGQRTPDQIARKIADRFEVSMGRAETIVRTEGKRLQNFGAELRIGDVSRKAASLGIPVKRTWIHSSGAVKGFRAGKTRAAYTPRPHHKAMHGVQVGADEKFELRNYETGEVWMVDGPHDPILPAREAVNCFVGETVVDARSVKTAFRSEYTGDLITIRTALGNEITGTPNHPIATPRGFVPLALLDVGSDVFTCALGQKVSVTDPDVDYVPSTIEQVFDAFSMVSPRGRVSRANVNFYGDSPDGDVDVVSPLWNLKSGLVPKLVHPSRELEFAVPDILHGLLSSDRRSSQAFLAGRTPAHGLVGGHGHRSFLFGSGSTAPSLLGLSGPAERDAGETEMFADVPPAVSGRLRNAENGLAGDVPVDDFSNFDRWARLRLGGAHLHVSRNEAQSHGPRSVPGRRGDFRQTLTSAIHVDKVVNVSARYFRSVHVFTFETESGIYNSNTIIASNCYCDRSIRIDREALKGK